ncbi:CoA transferase [Paeniroseomonas aquatica]|uniref:CoA transferase n=1 Tax=Paeniroseomonas aquatica TaxID=373043 RepID=UPI00361C8232
MPASCSATSAPRSSSSNRRGRPAAPRAALVETGTGTDSALFAWLNTNKRSVTRLDGIAECDVLLDGRPPADRAAASPPATVTAGISWFGDSGPYRDYAASDVTCRALAGIIAGTGPVEGPPSMLGGIAGAVVGGIAAFNAVAAALLPGAPRRLEVSIHEANVAVAEYQAAQGITHPEVERRHGVNRFAPTCPLGVYPCREGWLGVTIVTPAQSRGFCDMIGAPEVGQDPRFVIGFDRLRHVAELEALFVPRLRERTAGEWFDEALRRRLPFAVVPDMARLLATPTHRARDAFGTVRIGAAGIEGPTLPQRLTRTPPLAGGTAPASASMTAWRCPTAPPESPHASRRCRWPGCG